MGILQVLAVYFGLFCLVYLMTKEESVEIGPQTQRKKTDELCGGLRTILEPIYPFLLLFTNATELTSLYTAFSFWQLQHGSFTWLKVTIMICHFMVFLLITPVKKMTSALCGYHKVSAKNRHLDPFSVERKSSYKSIFEYPMDVNYPTIPDSKLSSILPLVSRVPHKLKHLFTTPNLVPVNVIWQWLFGGSTTYCAHMFKKKVTSNTWKVCVVIVQEECGAAAKSGLFDYEAVQQFKVTFSGDKIILNIRKEDHNMGWSITPENSLEITKESVDGYRGEGTMPCCRLNVKWNKGDNFELKQELCLEGTTDCSNIFQLMCIYEASPCAYVFRKKCTANTWMMNVVIIRDYAKCIKAVKEEFRDHDEAVSPFPVEFEKDAVVLKICQKEIPYSEGLDINGWKITPDDYAEITKESVDRFPDGAIKPYCRLEVEWKGGNNSSELKQVVHLEGAKGRRSVFQLMCSYEASPCAFVFKKKCTDKTWMVNVVIVRDEAEIRNAAVSEFKGYEQAVRAFPVEFEKDAVVLKICEKGISRESSVDIPYPEGLDLKGWTITSDSPLDITKESVKQFPGGTIKPWCELKVEWKGEGNSELKQVVRLEGAKGPLNVFQLMCSYEVSHCAYVFKKKRAANTWIMDVVVARDNKECKDAVECKFQGHEVAVPPFPVKFEKDADTMVLKILAREKGSPNVEIPYPKGLDVSGWHITPENPPDITRECVNRYPSGLMPRCQFTVKWNGADKDKSDLERVMCLEGARGPRNVFRLMCSYKETKRLCSVFGKKYAEGSRWMVNVVIVRDDEECTNALRGEFQDHVVAVEPFAVKFEEDTTVLKIRNGDGKNVDIPQPQGLDVDGWNITPTRHPEITKDCVNSYPDCGQKPWCQLTVKWKGGVNSELKKVVCLDGAKHPRNVFTLICNYQGSTELSLGPVILDHKPTKGHQLSEVIKRTQAIWTELADALRFDNHEIAAIERNNHNVMDMCRVMMGKWLEGRGERGPRNWRTLLEALRDIDRTELANELSQKL